MNTLLGTSLPPSRFPVLVLCLMFNQTFLCIRTEADRCIPSRCCLKRIRKRTPRVVLLLLVILIHILSCSFLSMSASRFLLSLLYASASLCNAPPLSLTDLSSTND